MATVEFLCPSAIRRGRVLQGNFIRIWSKCSFMHVGCCWDKTLHFHVKLQNDSTEQDSYTQPRSTMLNDPYMDLTHNQEPPQASARGFMYIYKEKNSAYSAPEKMIICYHFISISSKKYTVQFGPLFLKMLHCLTERNILTPVS